MLSYNELGTVKRGDPCKEYPGSWIVYCNGNTEKDWSFSTQAEAQKLAHKLAEEYDSKKQSEPLRVSVAWACSDNDPRIGEVWFTGYYTHGRINIFGQYVTT